MKPAYHEEQETDLQAPPDYDFQVALDRLVKAVGGDRRKAKEWALELVEETLLVKVPS